MQDREASLSRARKEAAFADGISWGMGEDAIEEDEVCMIHFSLLVSGRPIKKVVLTAFTVITCWPGILHISGVPGSNVLFGHSGLDYQFSFRTITTI